MDAILKVMVAFTDHSKRDEFVEDLHPDQHRALRELNVARINAGDDRIPEDYYIDGDGSLQEE